MAWSEIKSTGNSKMDELATMLPFGCKVVKVSEDDVILAHYIEFEKEYNKNIPYYLYKKFQSYAHWKTGAYDAATKSIFVEKITFGMIDEKVKNEKIIEKIFGRMMKNFFDEIK